MTIIQSGSIIDERYVIIRSVGEGGMGTVYEARETGLDRVIALKMLHRSLIGDEEQRLRFSREGRMLAALSHKHVLLSYRLGIWKNYPYIAMEYLKGRTLRAVIDDLGPFSVEGCIHIAIQICEGMAFVHGAGIVHRDLKPGNIMLLDQPESNFVKIVDFGLARLFEPRAVLHTLTQTGMLVGTVFYMSPEQCTGKRADHRSDVYSLGCIIYEMLTGVPPYDADNPVGLMHLHATAPTPRLPSGKAGVPAGLDNILSKAMEKNPQSRYQSMEDFQRDLELLLAGKGEEILASSGETMPGSPKRYSTIFALVLLCAGLAIIGCIFRFIGVSHPPINEPDRIDRVTVVTETSLHRDPAVALYRANMAIMEAARAYATQIKSPEAKEKLLRLDCTLSEIIDRVVDSPAVIFQAHMTRGFLCHEMSRIEDPVRFRWIDKENDEYRKALPYCLTETGKPSSSTAVVFAFMADAELSRDRYGEAMKLYKRALDLVDAPPPDITLDNRVRGILPKDAAIKYKTQIGYCEMEFHNYKSAELILRDAIKGWPSIDSAEITACRTLLDVLRLSGQQAAESRLILEIEQVAIKQRAGRQVDNDVLVSVYTALSMACSRGWTLERAVEMETKAVNLVDGVTHEVNLSDVEYSLDDLEYFARQRHDQAVRTSVEKMKERVHEMRGRR